MKLHDVVSHISSQNSIPTIAELVLRILSLDEKLSDLGGQSAYFRWGIQSHSKRLSALQKQYKCIRLESNNSSVNTLLHALNEEHQCINKVDGSRYPLFAKNIVKNAAIGRIEMLLDWIEMKGITQILPPIGQLKNDTNLLLKTLD